MIYTLYFDIISNDEKKDFHELELYKLFYKDLDELKDDITIRPKIDQNKVGVNEEWIIKLMKNCWNVNPHERKSFRKIVRILKKQYEKIRMSDNLLSTFFFKQKTAYEMIW